MSPLRGEGHRAEKVVQLQPLARRLQLNDLEDDLGQANLGPHRKGTSARRGDFGVKGIQIEIGATLQRASEAAGRKRHLRI